MHTPHDLTDEFPEHADRIHALKLSDPHFAKLFEAYFNANEAVYRAETTLEPMDGLAETALRKTRAALKDQIYHILTAAQPTT